MNRNRLVLLFVVVAVTVLIGMLLSAFVPSLMQTILDMHGGR